MVAKPRAAVSEPDWTRLLPDRGERAAAKAHWKRLTGEMADSDTLAPSNGHALQRLVIAYVVYDRCSQAVGAGGVVTEAAQENAKAIARMSIHYKAMSEAAKEAERLEAQLGISPQRRGKVGKVAKRKERSAGADAFLKPAG